MELLVTEMEIAVEEMSFEWLDQELYLVHVRFEASISHLTEDMELMALYVSLESRETSRLVTQMEE